MQLKCGTYSWATSGVTCKTRITPLRNTAGMPMTEMWRMTVTGDLLAPIGSTNPQSDLTAMQLAMQAALNVPYQDVVLFNDDGSPSATLLLNAGSVSGVRKVDGPNFEGDRATGQYAVVRTFSFAMECEYLAPNRLTPLMSFQESISYGGGLPIRTMCRAVNRPPIDQVTWPYTEFEAVQSGHAVGLLDWPFGGPNTMPAYKFPAAMLRSAPSVEPSGPDRVGPTTYKNFAVKWSAKFASALPLNAAPTLWT